MRRGITCSSDWHAKVICSLFKKKQKKTLGPPKFTWILTPPTHLPTHLPTPSPLERNPKAKVWHDLLLLSFLDYTRATILQGPLSFSFRPLCSPFALPESRGCATDHPCVVFPPSTEHWQWKIPSICEQTKKKIVRIHFSLRAKGHPLWGHGIFLFFLRA